MPQNLTKTRKAGALGFNLFGQAQRLEIKGALPIRTIGIDLSGTLTATGGTTDGTALADAPFCYMRSILLQENGGRLLYFLAGGDSADVAQQIYGTRVTGTSLTAGAGAGNPFQAYFEIPFSTPRFFSDNPDDTLYDAAGKILSLECTIGNASDGGFRAADNDRVLSALSASASVEIEEVIATQPSTNPVKLKLVSTWNFFRDTNVSTASRFQRKLNTGSVYRTLVPKLMAAITNANSSFNPSDTPLNNLTLESGALGTIVQTAKNHLRSRTQMRYQEETNRAGVYAIDMARFTQQFSDALETAGSGDLSIFYDVTKPANNLDIVTIYNEVFRSV